MTSERNIPDSSRDRNPERLLDAALATVLAVGVRRTTLTDVARRAHVSRMTAYRHFPDVASVLRALMTREFARLLAEIGTTVAHLPTARERLVASLLSVVDDLPAQPLFARILEVDPELLLPYVTERLGVTQVAARALLTDQLVEGIADGSVRDVDPPTTALTLLLVVAPFVYGRRIIERAADPAVLNADLRHLLHAHLRPPETQQRNTPARSVRTSR